MKTHKRATFVFLAIAIISIAIATAALRAQVQQSSGSEVKDGQLPLATYDSLDSADSATRALRHARSNRYDKSHVVQPPSPEVTEVLLDSHWLYFPALPAAQSDSVIIGEVIDAQAYLSNDKTGIYSEFTVQVSSTLKDNTGQINLNDKITTERAGGRVKFPSNRIIKYSVEGQGVPQVHRRYLFFLKHDAQRQTYLILTAYELRGGHIAPLDDGAGGNNPFKSYEGVKESRFLEAVQGAIAKSQQAITEKGVTGP